MKLIKFIYKITKIFALNGPYLTKYLPPAWVDTLPPTKHDPFAPKSQGISH